MRNKLASLALAIAAVLCWSAAQAGERTFAVVYPIINPFFEGTSIGAEDEAKDLGVAVLIKGPTVSTCSSRWKSSKTSSP